MFYTIEQLLRTIVIVALICGLISIGTKAIGTYEDAVSLTGELTEKEIGNVANKSILSLENKRNSGKYILAKLKRISRLYTILFKRKQDNEYILYGKLIKALNYEEVSDRKFIVRELPEYIEYKGEDNDIDVAIVDAEPLYNFSNKYYDNEQYYIRSDLYYYTYVIYDKLKQPKILVIEEV